MFCPPTLHSFPRQLAHQKKISTKQFLCHLKFFFYQQAVVPTLFNLFSTSRCATDGTNSLYVFHTLTSMCATDVFKVLVLQKRCHSFLLLPSQPRLSPYCCRTVLQNNTIEHRKLKPLFVKKLTTFSTIITLCFTY